MQIITIIITVALVGGFSLAAVYVIRAITIDARLSGPMWWAIFVGLVVAAVVSGVLGSAHISGTGPFVSVDIKSASEAMVSYSIPESLNPDERVEDIIVKVDGNPGGMDIVFRVEEGEPYIEVYELDDYSQSDYDSGAEPILGLGDKPIGRYAFADYEMGPDGTRMVRLDNLHGYYLVTIKTVECVGSITVLGDEVGD